MLNIALAKGRIAKTVFKRLINSGYEFPEYTKESRKLIFTDSTGSVRVTFVKSPDIAVYVRRGAADAGIVGKDVLLEEGEEDVYELMDLGIGRCRMAVAGIKGNNEVLNKKILTVASKYPKIARHYFASRYKTIDVIRLNGSVELAPLVGLSDVIVDIVETGTTLKENGLEAYDFFMTFSARLIANKVAYKMKHEELMEFMNAIKG